MVNAYRNQFSDESNRNDEWVWYDRDDDWRISVSDQGATRPNRFNVILSTDLYERDDIDAVLGDTRVLVDEVIGYESAMARAGELIQIAAERVAESEVGSA